MYQSIYYVDKSTNTFSDVLATYGLAKILDEILAQALGRESPRKVWIQDMGPYYMVQLSTHIQSEWVDKCSYFNGPPFYITNSKIQSKPGTMSRDVDKTWEQNKIYQERRKQLKNIPETDENLKQQLQDIQPPYDWEIVTLLGDSRIQALKTYNQAVNQWALLKDYFTINLKTILNMCAKPYTDIKDITPNWQKEVKIKDPSIKRELTSIQLLNPHQGKGLNEPKSNSLTMGNMKSFWLIEYMKSCGLWLCTAPRRKDGNSDLKIYIIAPHRITLAAHQAVFETFCRRLWSNSSAKMDCIAALLYTDILLKHSEAGQYDELDFDGYGPEDVVSGFHVVQYKLLSRNAYTAINLAFLGLPNWTGEVKKYEKVKELQNVIEEHMRVVESIDEGRSDGYNLLLLYRDFLSGGNWGKFFDFTAGYSHYIMGQFAQGRYVPLFTTTSIRRLIMATKKPLIEIVENSGFQNVAYAIRHSTVIPQSRKARNQDTLYEIRYGLGMDLKRKSTVRDDFINALSDFMQSYNQENNRILERVKKQMRRDIRTLDIQEIVNLVDSYGSEVIANLLVAYGYARESREETDDSTNETSI